MAANMTNVTGEQLRLGRTLSPSEVLQDQCEPISGLHYKPGTAPAGTPPELIDVSDKAQRFSEEHGWLIEHQLTGVLWLYLNAGEIQWTTDSNDALRFARKEDAERFRLFARLGIGFSVTEHTWS